MPGSSATSNGHLHHHHHHHHHGEGGGGGGQGQEHANASPSDRKGHDEDKSMFSTVGQIVKRARRRVNSYLSALARQQRELARQQRERERKKSITSSPLEDAEAADSLLETRSGGGGRDGDDFSAQGEGFLHRSQSAIFVGHGQLSPKGAQTPKGLRQHGGGANTPTEIELGDIEAGGGGGGLGDSLDDEERRGGGETASLLPSTEEGYFVGGGGGDGGKVAGSLRRGHMSQTTGDLLRLQRVEQQGAGEDSAQEDRERSRGGAGNAQVRWKSSNDFFLLLLACLLRILVLAFAIVFVRVLDFFLYTMLSHINSCQNLESVVTHRVLKPQKDPKNHTVTR